jgi:predicted PurR-regulated permease PerM
VANSSTSKPRDTLLILGVLVLVTACLYWARQVLIPVALAVLLAFILTPAVSALQRRGLGRLPSVLLVVSLTLLLLGGAGYVISHQINTLVANLDNYKGEIIKKFKALRGAGEDGIFGRSWNFIEDISTEVVDKTTKKEKGDKKGEPSSTVADESTETEPKKKQPGMEPSDPLYVQIAPSGWTRAMEAIGPAAEGLGEAFLVLVLVIFMLMQRENLRNRLVRLIGHGRLIVTTQAFDESAHRISRFLLMQLLINLLFGVTLAVGLFAAGLILGHRVLWQYALLWGFVACVLRFVPYLGTWLAAALVTGFSIATLPGWYLPLGVFAFFLVIELLTANVVEPLLFGHSTGISPLALLLAAAFWTWLWGPVGLVLSTPLTVILVILGKYVPELQFFEVLLGDEPVLSTDVTFYQRLVARDLDEASGLVEDYLRDHEPGEVYEDVLLPALLHAKRDRDRGELETDNYDFVLHGIRDVEEDLAAAIDVHFKEVDGAKKVVAVGCPGRDEADELALVMLGQLLRLSGYALEVVSSKKLTGEVLKQLESNYPVLVCIGSLVPGGLSQARYLCKRIRQQHPDLKILVGRWGDKDNVERTEKRLRAAGADQMATTLRGSCDQIVPLLQVVVHAVPTETKAPELIPTR